MPIFPIIIVEHFNHLTRWVIFHAFVVFCWLFSKLSFSKNSFRNNIRVSNGLDPDQGRHSVSLGLGRKCLQIKELSADDKILLARKGLNSVSQSQKKGQGAGPKKGTFDARNSPKRALLLEQTFQM